MSFINPQEKEINCKIIYYGPSFAGKTTSLSHIYHQSAPGQRSMIESLSGEDSQTLYFDFLPLTLGKVRDYTIRFHLYTVPGQVIYDSSRNIILKGIDGVIFVVDSQIERLEDNLESWRNLETNLRNQEIEPETIPMALEYNKRDLKNVFPVSELHQIFNQRNLPEFETVATKGIQIMECFQSVAKKVLQDLEK